MRVLSNLVTVFVLFLCSCASFAEDSAALLQVLRPIRSLQADFVQTILDHQGKALQKSEGHMVLQRPGAFRWDVRRPIPQLIIANNTRLWIYDPDLEQVVIRPVAKEIGKTPAFLLSNMDTALARDFTVRRLSAPASWQWYSLTPKTKDSLFRVIELGFLNSKIKEMRMQDNLGHRTIIQFHHIRENQAVASSAFHFHAPAKVDVIDETR